MFKVCPDLFTVLILLFIPHHSLSQRSVFGHPSGLPSSVNTDQFHPRVHPFHALPTRWSVKKKKKMRSHTCHNFMQQWAFTLICTKSALLSLWRERLPSQPLSAAPDVLKLCSSAGLRTDLRVTQSQPHGRPEHFYFTNMCQEEHVIAVQSMLTSFCNRDHPLLKHVVSSQDMGFWWKRHRGSALKRVSS